MAEATSTLDRRRILAAISTEIGQGQIAFSTSARLALRVRNALDDPDCVASTVVSLIQAEPLLAARTVALANSALFSRSGRVITDIPGAVARVGFSVVRALATALVARQIAGAPTRPAYRDMAAALWEHTTHMAALAYVLARRVTRQDPDTAMFAGLVHEVGGFYLISRADEFPGLLDGGLASDWMDDGEYDAEISGNAAIRSFESQIGNTILEALSVPPTIVAAIETLWRGYLTLPPETLGDTLLLADRLVPVSSPFYRPPEGAAQRAAATIDMAVEDETLTDVLKEAGADVKALAAILRG